MKNHATPSKIQQALSLERVNTRFRVRCIQCGGHNRSTFYSLIFTHIFRCVPDAPMHIATSCTASVFLSQFVDTAMFYVISCNNYVSQSTALSYEPNPNTLDHRRRRTANTNRAKMQKYQLENTILDRFMIIGMNGPCVEICSYIEPCTAFNPESCINEADVPSTALCTWNPKHKVEILLVQLDQCCTIVYVADKNSFYSCVV